MNISKFVVGQPCLTDSVRRFRNWFPNAGTSVLTLMPHLRTRCCVFVHTSRNGFLHAETHNVEQTEKMIPLITGEMAFRQQVCELALVSTHVWIFGFKLIVKQPMKRDSVGSGHVSHRRTLAF